MAAGPEARLEQLGARRHLLRHRLFFDDGQVIAAAPGGIDLRPDLLAILGDHHGRVPLIFVAHRAADRGDGLLVIADDGQRAWGLVTGVDLVTDGDAPAFDRRGRALARLDQELVEVQGLAQGDTSAAWALSRSSALTRNSTPLSAAGPQIPITAKKTSHR